MIKMKNTFLIKITKYVGVAISLLIPDDYVLYYNNKKNYLDTYII